MNAKKVVSVGELRLDDNQGSRHSGTEGSTRPTLDHLVELTCLAIARAGRRGALPIKAVEVRR
jgi:hypothetical protein